MNTKRTLRVVAAVLLSFSIGAQADWIYWTDYTGGTIKRTDLAGGPIETLVIGLSGPHGLDLDVPNEQMYWTDLTTDSIQRAGADGTGVEDLIVGYVQPFDVALDLIEGKMYYVSNVFDRVDRSDLDGSNQETVVPGLFDPVRVAVDSLGRKVYWVDCGSNKIQRSDVDGGAIEDVATGSHPLSFCFAQDIALDVDNGKIYWGDGFSGQILRANLDGSGAQAIILGQDLALGHAMVVYEDKLYWSNNAGLGANSNKIQRTDLDGMNIEEILDIGDEKFGDIAIYPSQTVDTCVLVPNYDNGTITLSFIFGTAQPATWDVWVSVRSNMVQILSVDLPIIDSPVSVNLTLSNIPQLGTIGFLTTFTTLGKGIMCSDWEELDTGPSNLSADTMELDLLPTFVIDGRVP